MNGEITGTDLFEEWLHGYIDANMDRIIPDVWEKIEEKIHVKIRDSIESGEISPDVLGPARIEWAEKLVNELIEDFEQIRKGA